MPRNPEKKKKARDRAEIKDLAAADDARQEISDKIQKRKVARGKSKSSFTRRKNQLLDLLEDAIAANHREIRDSRKLLNEAQERVVVDLSSLAELYSKASVRSALEKTSREIEDIEEEFFKLKNISKSICMPSKMNSRVKHQNFPGKLLSLHSKEKKARRHLEEKFRKKEESINRARKQLDEEYARRQKEMETKI